MEWSPSLQRLRIGGVLDNAFMKRVTRPTSLQVSTAPRQGVSVIDDETSPMSAESEKALTEEVGSIHADFPLPRRTCVSGGKEPATSEGMAPLGQTRELAARSRQELMTPGEENEAPAGGAFSPARAAMGWECNPSIDTDDNGTGTREATFELQGSTSLNLAHLEEGFLRSFSGTDVLAEETEGGSEPSPGRGRPWWGRKLIQAALVVMLAIGGRVLMHGERQSSLPRNCSKTADVLGAGGHIPSKRMIPWFGGRIPGTQWAGVIASWWLNRMARGDKSSATVDVPEGQRRGGFLCSVEQFARAISGQAQMEYGLTMKNGELVLGAGRFCQVFATSVPRGIDDHLGLGKRGGKVRNARGVYNSAGDFEVVSRWGWVLWSTAHPEGKGGGGWRWWRPRKKMDSGTGAPRARGPR